jgi:hypothetical protein
LNTFVKETFDNKCKYKIDKEAKEAHDALKHKVIIAMVFALLLICLLFPLYFFLRRRCARVAPSVPLGHQSPLVDIEYGHPEAPSGPAWEAFQKSQPNLAHDVLECHSCMSDPRKMANAGEETFSSLKRNVRALQRSGAIKDTVGKPTVLHFLAQFASQNQYYRAQSKEVWGWLEASPSWAQAISNDSKLRSLKAAAFTCQV